MKSKHQDQMLSKQLSNQLRVTPSKATLEMLRQQKVASTAVVTPKNKRITKTKSRKKTTSQKRTSSRVVSKRPQTKPRRHQMLMLMSTVSQSSQLVMPRKMLRSKSSIRSSTKKGATANGPSRVLISYPWSCSSSRVYSEVERARSVSRDAAQPIGCSSQFSL